MHILPCCCYEYCGSIFMHWIRYNIKKQIVRVPSFLSYGGRNMMSGNTCYYSIMPRALIRALRAAGQSLDKVGASVEVAPFIEGCKCFPPRDRHLAFYSHLLFSFLQYCYILMSISVSFFSIEIKLTFLLIYLDVCVLYFPSINIISATINTWCCTWKEYSIYF